MKERRGSALAYVLIVFAILMIFGTVTLRLAVTESKQSMRQQNRTQAYYIARSGVETVEKAILKIYSDEDEENINIYNNFTTALKTSQEEAEKINGDFSGIGDPVVKIWKEIKGPDEMNIHILSTGEANGVKTSVEKILPVDIEPGGNEINLGDKPIITEEFEFKESVHKDVIKQKDNWVKEDENFRSNYLPYVFEYDSYSDVPEENVGVYPDEKNITLGSGSEDVATNYFLDSLTIGDGTTITINGKVNIYIKRELIIDGTDININESGKKDENGEKDDDLNFYIYGEGVTGNSLFIKVKGQNKHNIANIIGNFYVNSGNIYYFGDESYMEGNIISNGEKITIETQTSAGKDNIVGIVYAPQSEIHISPDTDNSAIHFKGYLIAQKVIMGKTHHNKTTIRSDEDIGITNPDIIKGLDVMIIKPGYYK